MGEMTMSLMALPQEVRSLIYHFVFAGARLRFFPDLEARKKDHYLYSIGATRKLSHSPVIGLLVCSKTTGQEAKTALYQQANLDISLAIGNDGSLNIPVDPAQLCHIDIHCDVLKRPGFKYLLQSMKALETLTVYGHHTIFVDGAIYRLPGTRRIHATGELRHRPDALYTQTADAVRKFAHGLIGQCWRSPRPKAGNDCAGVSAISRIIYVWDWLEQPYIFILRYKVIIPGYPTQAIAQLNLNTKMLDIYKIDSHLTERIGEPIKLEMLEY